MKSLVVEDDPIVRELLKHILEQYGTCDLAIDGELGVAAYRMAFKLQSPYDLVCMDVEMPRKNGLQALREIRELEFEEEVKNLAKVVVITSHDDTDTILDSFRRNCDGFVSKPIDRDAIQKMLRQLGLIG